MRGGIICNEWTNGNTEHVVWKGIRKKNPTSRKDKNTDFLNCRKVKMWIKCGISL